jgi:hypothetical protein
MAQQENNNKSNKKYIRLKTDYPFSSRTPIGHSTLIVPTSGGKLFNISKGPHNPDYNLLCNNCSDATREALEIAFNRKMNPFLFTTPGDVRDFAIEELGAFPFIKGDSIFDINNGKYRYAPRSKVRKHIKKLSPGFELLNEPDTHDLLIPMNNVDTTALFKYLREGRQNKKF